jgi:hypothetical protein
VGPDGALLEAVLDGVVIYDVSHCLPQHATKRYIKRNPEDISVVFHHHSGALGRAGYEGLAASARYVVNHNDWPGCSYTFWLPFVPERDSHGNIVIYRGQPDTARSFHTGGDANRVGIAVCWQGNLSTQVPSAEQYQAAEALELYVRERYGPLAVSTHAESKLWGGSGRASCPGPNVTRWLAGRVGAQVL